MIDVKNIVVQFKDKKVLDDISIQFHEGEIIGLVAPNGTGKSTFLNVLMNYVSPNKGTVIFNGKMQYKGKKSEARIRSQITMMPDQSDLYNHLNGMDHLKIYERVWKKTSISPEKVVEHLKMGSYVKNKTGTYSLGMRQRLCLAMQIVANTPFMLMDEVMNGLDPDNVELISKLLEEKKAEGKIIIIASHLLENLEKYADRIFFLKDGKFIYQKDYTKDVAEKETLYIKFSTRDNEQIVKSLQGEFPELMYQALSNERILLDFDQFNEAERVQIQNMLTNKYNINYQVGPLDLSDRYSVHYN